MTIKNHRTLLLLVASITLAGCQTTTTTPFKDATQYENIVTLKAEIDSDGDGVPDELDMCPATPENAVVDDRGCPITTGPMTNLKMEYRAFFAKGSSELLPKYQLELDKVGIKMHEHNAATMRIEGSISESEINHDGLIIKSYTLAKNRAMIVKNYLTMHHKINPKRITTYDCYANIQIAPNDTEEGRFFNRRVYGLVTEPEDEVVYQYPKDSISKTCIEF